MFDIEQGRRTERLSVRLTSSAAQRRLTESGSTAQTRIPVVPGRIINTQTDTQTNTNRLPTIAAKANYSLNKMQLKIVENKVLFRVQSQTTLLPVYHIGHGML
ncbi:hypothetical protein KSX_20380 [Ktedonospora formicarum]|uniref:Uncharacterized protein n=1 Tax=Ktedonospora formicarum TaxID=2778364 RepID=A0A8J3HZA1_9CHLR|nr:hypothetical protein KSX_20380 [Ktedonospora formicarum]